MNGQPIIRVAGLIAVAVIVSGCSAGRGDDGSIVIGARVADLVETPGQALSAAAGLLPGPWGAIATIGATILGGGGIAAAARVSGRRTGERNGWEEAQALFTTPPGYYGGIGPRAVGDVNAGAAVAGGSSAAPETVTT